MYKLIFFSLLVLVISNVSAQDLSARYLGMSIEGGATAGYFRSNNVFEQGSAPIGSSYVENKDNVALSDFMLEFRTRKMGALDAEMRFGLGSLKKISLLDANGNRAMSSIYQSGISTVNIDSTTNLNIDRKVGIDDVTDVNIQYAQISVSPVDNAFIEAGQLASNFGYEVAPTYANWNSTLGMAWARQPTYYPGARIRYEVNDVNVYAEFNQDGITDGQNGWVLGAYGNYQMLRFSAGYFDTYDGRNLVDVMVEADLPHTIVAVNFDYHLLDNTPATSSDRSAYSIATFVVPYFKRYYFPIRFEYISDGGSNIFGVNYAYTVTISPTVYITENAFARLEGSYVSSNNDVFVQLSDNVRSFENWAFNAQIGYYF